MLGGGIRRFGGQLLQRIGERGLANCQLAWQFLNVISAGTGVCLLQHKVTVECVQRVDT
jgi:hypothetical protein